MPQVIVHTLGCKLNSLESESYREQFANSNEQIVLINTCTVTSKAEQKCRRVIRKALKDYPDAKIIVTGCYAALEKGKIEELDSHKGTEAQRLFVKLKEELLNNKFDFFPEKFTSHTRSFLKIQDGCNNHCTYCRIRLARGKSVSLQHEQVLERLRILEQSYAETVLTGVNISQYKDNKFNTELNNAALAATLLTQINLFNLIEYILANTDKIAIRLSSLDPQFIVDSLTTNNYILTTNRIRPHFHLSIQSCSESILKRMGRSYNAPIIENAVKLLRSVKDDPFLACDIITGFPGETEKEFAETYELCKKLGFAWIHVFPYSKRPGTVAAEFKDSVKESEVTRRVKLFTDLAWQGRREYVKRWIGREVETIIIRNEELGIRNEEDLSCFGLSENYLKVLVKCNKGIPAAGTVLWCRLTEQSPLNNDEYDAIAETL